MTQSNDDFVAMTRHTPRFGIARAGAHDSERRTVREWHPLLAAVEHEPGQWTLTGQLGPYAIVRSLEVGGERGYRASTYSEPRQLIGYYRTLRAACAAAHSHYVMAHGPDSSTVGCPKHLSGESVSQECALLTSPAWDSSADRTRPAPKQRTHLRVSALRPPN